MPAESEKQRRAAGAALAAKRGEMPASELKGASKEMYESMSEEQLRDFAKKSAFEAAFVYNFVKLANGYAEGELDMSDKGETAEDVLAESGPDKKEQIKDYLEVTPDLDDDALHNFAQNIGLEPDEAEELVNQMAQEYIQAEKGTEGEPPIEEALKGGKGDNKRPDVTPREESKGIAVEMEHTNNPEEADEIQRDHHAEFPNYYEALAEMENALKENREPEYGKISHMGVAFVRGYIDRCVEQGMQDWQVKMACAVGSKIISNFRPTFQKVIQKVAMVENSESNNALSAGSTNKANISSGKPSDEANAFMTQHIKRKAKEQKIKNPADVTSAAGVAWKQDAGKKVIGNVAAQRRMKAGIPAMQARPEATMA